MDKLLISLEDIKRFRPLSKNIPTDRIEPYIKEAQFSDLRPLLGEALYYDFMNTFGTDQKYIDLLKGKVYTPTGSSYSIEYPGIVPMLCYYSLARFYANNSFNVTSYGLVSKKNEESEPLERNILMDAINEVRANGIGYQNMVIKFLQDNISTYTLFPEAEQSSQNTTGVKFFDV